MQEEIKEILDYLKKEVNKFEESKTYLMETYNYREQDIENIEQHKKYVYFKKLLDYITNLQEENDYYFKKNNELSILNTSLRSNRDDYKSRCEKAVEYIKKHLEREYFDYDILEANTIYNRDLYKVLNILQGVDKE